MSFKKQHYIMASGVVVAVFLFVYFASPLFRNDFSYSSSLTATATAEKVVPVPVPVVKHLPPRDPLKGIYMTACVASGRTYRDRLIKLADDTEINAIVINIKDETGTIAIDPTNPLLKPAHAVATCPVSDMKELVDLLHSKDIYAIARIAVFQDPFLVKQHPEWAVKRASDGAVWRDRKGIPWLDVKAKPVWDYIVALSRESEKLGFDEIQFDYIRFPSDGNMQDIAYPYYRASQESKATAMKDFFIYIHSQLKDLGIPLSVDLFGMTTTNTDDLGIGQVLENALPYFDYVLPMVYPSHWPAGWNGLKKPAENPYEVIKVSMQAAVNRAKAASTTPLKLRPWLQDFDLGADYDVAKIRAQIQATYDAGLTSWIVWDPRNIYTESAYLPEKKP